MCLRHRQPVKKVVLHTEENVNRPLRSQGSKNLDGMFSISWTLINAELNRGITQNIDPGVISVAEWLSSRSIGN
jgi:hypothetical protein